MVESTDTRLQLALRAACEVSAMQGLKFEQAVVLQNFSNVIIHLAPTSVVAKVSTTTGTIRAGDAWFAREVEIAKYLTVANAPIIPLSSALEPGPHHHLGLVLSFWEFVQILDEPFDPHQAGQALRRCHEALKGFSGELPVLALISEARQLLDRLITESEFTTTDAEMLLRVTQRLEPQLQQLPMQPLHGDTFWQRSQHHDQCAVDGLGRCDAWTDRVGFSFSRCVSLCIWYGSRQSGDGARWLWSIV